MVKFPLGGVLLRNRKIQNANNYHHLQAGHQAQHGGLRHPGTKVGRNGIHMGRRKVVRQKVERQCQIHAPKGIWKQLA